MEDQNPPGGQWQFRPDDNPQPTPEQINTAVGANSAVPSSIAWTASEFIEHEKSFSWYLLLALAAVVVSGGLYWLTRDLITAIIIGLVAIIFGIAAARKPRQIDYVLDAKGLTVGNRFLPFNEYRAFTIEQEGAITSVSLYPLKRFVPLTVVYLDPQDEDKVINLLSEYLPLDQSRNDPVDRLMRRIRF